MKNQNQSTLSKFSNSLMTVSQQAKIAGGTLQKVVDVRGSGHK